MAGAACTPAEAGDRRGDPRDATVFLFAPDDPCVFSFVQAIKYTQTSLCFAHATRRDDGAIYFILLTCVRYTRLVLA